MWRTPRPSSTNTPAPLRHADGFPVLGLLRVLRHPAASSEVDLHPKMPSKRTSLLGRASQVPLSTLTHSRLGFNFGVPIRRSAGSLKHRRIVGCPDDPTGKSCSPVPWLAPEIRALTRSSLPLFRGAKPDGFGIDEEGGWLYPRVVVDSFRSHAGTLPGKAPMATKLRLCLALSGELFRLRFRCPKTYSVDTMTGQTVTVRDEHCR